MVMIGISTEQNTTNLIPAIQHKVDKFLLVESQFANEQKWSKGLAKVLTQRGIRVEYLTIEKQKDTNIEGIYESLIEKVSQIDEPIIWNGGGGQKIHFAAIWDCFNVRKKDKFCYANPNSTIIEWWVYENGIKKSNKEVINVDLTASEILNTYGFDVTNESLIYDKSKPSLKVQEVNDLMRFDNFREYLFNLPREKTLESVFSLKELNAFLESNKFDFRNNTIKIIKESRYFKLKQELLQKSAQYKNAVLPAIIDTQDSEFKSLVGIINNSFLDLKGFMFKKLTQDEVRPPIKITNQNLQQHIQGYLRNKDEIPCNNDLLNSLHPQTTSASKYFELVVAQRIRKQLITTEHCIKYAYANLKAAKNEKESGEYDVLLVTQYGTLLAFDAKTYDFDKKDADARLLNLERAGGRYVKFMVVLPYNIKDMAIINDKLRELPFLLKERGMTFFVVTEDTNNCAYIKKQGDGLYEIVASTDENEANVLKCTPIEGFIEALRLQTKK